MSFHFGADITVTATSDVASVTETENIRAPLAAASKCGKYVAASSGNELVLWSVIEAPSVAAILIRSPEDVVASGTICSIVWRRSSKMLALATDMGKLCLFRLHPPGSEDGPQSSNKLTLEPCGVLDLEGDMIRCLCSCGHVILIGGADGALRTVSWEGQLLEVHTPMVTDTATGLSTTPLSIESIACDWIHREGRTFPVLLYVTGDGRIIHAGPKNHRSNAVVHGEIDLEEMENVWVLGMSDVKEVQFSGRQEMVVVVRQALKGVIANYRWSELLNNNVEAIWQKNISEFDVVNSDSSILSAKFMGNTDSLLVQWEQHCCLLNTNGYVSSTFPSQSRHSWVVVHDTLLLQVMETPRCVQRIECVTSLPHPSLTVLFGPEYIHVRHPSSLMTSPHYLRIPVDHLYALRNWPLQLAELSPAGSQLAVAGRGGFCTITLPEELDFEYICLDNSWKVMESGKAEDNFRVSAMVWWNQHLLLAVYQPSDYRHAIWVCEEGNPAMRSELVEIKERPTHLSVAGETLSVASRSGQLSFYRLKQRSAPSSSWWPFTANNSSRVAVTLTHLHDAANMPSRAPLKSITPVLIPPAQLERSLSRPVARPERRGSSVLAPTSVLPTVDDYPEPKQPPQSLSGRQGSSASSSSLKPLKPLKPPLTAVVNSPPFSLLLLRVDGEAWFYSSESGHWLQIGRRVLHLFVWISHQSAAASLWSDLAGMPKSSSAQSFQSTSSVSRRRGGPVSVGSQAVLAVWALRGSSLDGLVLLSLHDDHMEVLPTLHTVPLEDDTTILSLSAELGAFVAASSTKFSASVGELPSHDVQLVQRSFLQYIFWSILSSPFHLSLAMQFSSLVRDLPTFESGMERMLHMALEQHWEENHGGSHHAAPSVLLQQAVDVVRATDKFHRIVAAVARKSEWEIASCLLDSIGEPLDLFQSILDRGDEWTASAYLLLIRRRNGPDVAAKCAFKLLHPALKQSDWNLVSKLYTFIKICDGELTELAMESPEDMVLLLQRTENMDSVKENSHTLVGHFVSKFLLHFRLLELDDLCRATDYDLVAWLKVEHDGMVALRDFRPAFRLLQEQVVLNDGFFLLKGEDAQHPGLLQRLYKIFEESQAAAWALLFGTVLLDTAGVVRILRSNICYVSPHKSLLFAAGHSWLVYQEFFEAVYNTSNFSQALYPGICDTPVTSS
jgi:hypothetical protein